MMATTTRVVIYLSDISMIGQEANNAIRPQAQTHGHINHSYTSNTVYGAPPAAIAPHSFASDDIQHFYIYTYVYDCI